MADHEPLPWEGKTHRDILLDVADDVLDYVTWYAENGTHLPKEFEDDPVKWIEILRQIEVACSILVVGPSMEPTRDRDLDVVRGIALFNKYIAHMWI